MTNTILNLVEAITHFRGVSLHVQRDIEARYCVTVSDSRNDRDTAYTPNVSLDAALTQALADLNHEHDVEPDMVPCNECGAPTPAGNTNWHQCAACIARHVRGY